MGIENICNICKLPDSIITTEDHDYIKIVDCKRCGKYSISRLDITLSDFSDVNKTSLLSYWIRKNQSKTLIRLDKDIIKNILKNNSLPEPREQADNLLNWIANANKKPGSTIKMELNYLVAVVGACDLDNIKMITRHLIDLGMFDSFDTTAFENDSKLCAVLSMKGWEKFHELQNPRLNGNVAFMAMEYRNDKLDELFNNVLRPAVKETGYTLKRLDDEPRAGIIDNQMRDEIRKAKFLIADLSTHNRGAYWEAGFAEGLGKKVIYICEITAFGNIHFDTNHCMTVLFTWDDTTEFANKLKKAIRHTFHTEAKLEE